MKQLRLNTKEEDRLYEITMRLNRKRIKNNKLPLTESNICHIILEYALRHTDIDEFGEMIAKNEDEEIARNKA